MEVAIVPSINMYNSSTTSQLPLGGMYNPTEDDLQFHQHPENLNVPLNNQENLPPMSVRKHGRSTSSVEPPHTIVKKKSRVGLQQQQQQQPQNSDHQHQAHPPMPDYTTINNTINASSTPLTEHLHSSKNSPLDANLPETTPSTSPSLHEMKNADEFVCVITPQGQVLYSTPTVQNLLGFHAPSLLQKTIMDFIHPHDRERFVQQADGTMANGNVLQVFYKLKTSSNVYKMFDIVGRPFYDASTNLSQLQVSLPGNTQQQNEATQAVCTSGKECRGLVLTLKTLDEVDNTSKSNNLWVRRQVSRLKKSPDMIQQQHPQFHHHGHSLERPASAASSISSNGGGNSNSADQHSSSSLVVPPPPHFTPPAPLNISHHQGLIGSIGAGIHSDVPSPHSSTPVTTAYESSGIITTTVLDSVPQSATTISSSIPSSLPTSASYPTSAFSESYDDSSLLYPPHSAGLVDEPWLPHAPSPLSAQITHGGPQKYAAFAANGRSYSYCEPNHTDGLGLITSSLHEDGAEFKSPHHRATYNHMVHPSHPSSHHPHPHPHPHQHQQSPNLPLQESPHTDHGLTPNSTPKSLYSQQNNSTSELSQQTARVTLEDQDPLANAAYWDNSANSELVSPQYYQQPAVASLIGANGYLMDPQMRGKSYSLPNAFEVPAVSNARYQTYYRRAATGEIDFSGYTMSMKPNPQMSQYHHHQRKNYNLGPGPMAKPPRRKSSKAHLGMETPHVCAECGAMESPEWRKGPKGPKTLCNACGLRWAKKTRKEEGQVQNAAAVALRKKQ